MKEIYQQASVHAHPHTHAEAHGGKRYTQKHQYRARRNFCEIFVKGGIHRETLYVIMKPQRETLFFENSILFQSVLAYDALDNMLLKYNKRNKRIAYLFDISQKSQLLFCARHVTIQRKQAYSLFLIARGHLKALFAFRTANYIKKRQKCWKARNIEAYEAMAY